MESFNDDDEQTLLNIGKSPKSFNKFNPSENGKRIDSFEKINGSTVDQSDLPFKSENENSPNFIQNLNDNSPPREYFTIILWYVGGYGWWQWRLLLITSFCGIFAAFHNFGAGEVKYCLINHLYKIKINLMTTSKFC